MPSPPIPAWTDQGDVPQGRVVSRRAIHCYVILLGCRDYVLLTWEWQWHGYANNQVWIGDANAGLALKLKDRVDRWDVIGLPGGNYQDWANNRRGGCRVSEVGSNMVRIQAYTGPMTVAAGQQLCFRFGLMATPTKIVNPQHWTWRHFHQLPILPVAEALNRGANHNRPPRRGHQPVYQLSLSHFAGDAGLPGAGAGGGTVEYYYTVREFEHVRPRILVLAQPWQ